jgi:regulator of cell morphogenesis and NO signaling
MITKDKKVGDFVKEDFRTAHVFSKFGIDFCCGGQIALKDACNKSSVDFRVVSEALNRLESDGERIKIIEDYNFSGLIDYIVQKHHTYTREKGQIILEYSNKVEKAHGDRYLESVELNQLVVDLIQDLMQHLMKEENVLFPSIIALENSAISNFPGNTIQHPISAMEHEHEIAGGLLEKISRLTSNYNPPLYACTTWKVLYKTLAEFETDLKTHIHIENNLLFPAVRSFIENI